MIEFNPKQVPKRNNPPHNLYVYSIYEIAEGFEIILSTAAMIFSLKHAASEIASHEPKR